MWCTCDFVGGPDAILTLCGFNYGAFHVEIALLFVITSLGAERAVLNRIFPISYL